MPQYPRRPRNPALAAACAAVGVGLLCLLLTFRKTYAAYKSTETPPGAPLNGETKAAAATGESAALDGFYFQRRRS